MPINEGVCCSCRVVLLRSVVLWLRVECEAQQIVLTFVCVQTVSPVDFLVGGLRYQLQPFVERGRELQKQQSQQLRMELLKPPAVLLRYLVDIVVGACS